MEGKGLEGCCPPPRPLPVIVSVSGFPRLEKLSEPDVSEEVCAIYPPLLSPCAAAVFDSRMLMRKLGGRDQGGLGLRRTETATLPICRNRGLRPGEDGEEGDDKTGKRTPEPLRQRPAGEEEEEDKKTTARDRWDIKTAAGKGRHSASSNFQLNEKF